jgi:hypothetical protein
MTEVTEPHYRPFFGDVGVDVKVSVSGPVLEPLARRTAGKLRGVGPARRAYLAWLNHAWGTVSMNMVATKPVRYVGTHEPVGPLRRLPRTLAAAVRTRRDRRTGRAPAKVPRTPEQATEALQRAAATTDSQRPTVPSG